MTDAIFNPEVHCDVCKGNGLIGQGDQPWLRQGTLEVCKTCSGTGTALIDNTIGEPTVEGLVDNTIGEPAVEGLVTEDQPVIEDESKKNEEVGESSLEV